MLPQFTVPHNCLIQATFVHFSEGQVVRLMAFCIEFLRKKLSFAGKITVLSAREFFYFGIKKRPAVLQVLKAKLTWVFSLTGFIWFFSTPSFSKVDKKAWSNLWWVLNSVSNNFSPFISLWIRILKLKKLTTTIKGQYETRIHICCGYKLSLPWWGHSHGPAKTFADWVWYSLWIGELWLWKYCTYCVIDHFLL